MKRKYWIEIDPETGNPKGDACWATYGLSDKPMEGHWLYVESAQTYCCDCNLETQAGAGSARCPSCWDDKCGR